MLPQALKNPNFARYCVGSIFNTMSFWVQRLCFGWLSWELTGSEFWVGMVAFLLFFPVLLFGPFFGVMADHIDRQKGAARILWVAATNLAIISVLTMLGHTNIELLCVFAGVVGIITSAFSPLRMAMVPALVERQEISSAVATGAIIFNTSRLLGPALAGVMISQFGVASALFLCVFLTLPLILILPTLKFRPRNPDAVSQKGLSGLKQGLGYVFSREVILWFLFLSALISIFGRGILELLPAFADGIFDRGSSGLAMMTASAGLGSILAGILLARYEASKMVSWSLASLGPMLLLFGVTEDFSMALFLVALVGFSITICGAGTQTMLQLMVDEDFRGRVMSIWGVVGFGGTAIGGLILGLASNYLGLGVATIVCAMIVVIGSAPIIYRIFVKKAVSL